MSSPTSLYRLFRRDPGEASSVRAVVIALVLFAVGLTAIGVIRVQRQQEVLRLGFQLSKQSEHVRKLRETRRQLELELGTLSSPERIARLAGQLGMAPVAPDRIRLVGPKRVDPTAPPVGAAAVRGPVANAAPKLAAR